MTREDSAAGIRPVETLALYSDARKLFPAAAEK